jgi:hypothetical protein
MHIGVDNNSALDAQRPGNSGQRARETPTAWKSGQSVSQADRSNTRTMICPMPVVFRYKGFRFS